MFGLFKKEDKLQAYVDRLLAEAIQKAFDTSYYFSPGCTSLQNPQTPIGEFVNRGEDFILNNVHKRMDSSIDKFVSSEKSIKKIVKAINEYQLDR